MGVKKYIPVLRHLTWGELIWLDDKALQDLGVNTQGARDMLVNAFNLYKGAHNPNLGALEKFEDENIQAQLAREKAREELERVRKANTEARRRKEEEKKARYHRGFDRNARGGYGGPSRGGIGGYGPRGGSGGFGNGRGGYKNLSQRF